MCGQKILCTYCKLFTYPRCENRGVFASNINILTNYFRFLVWSRVVTYSSWPSQTLKLSQSVSHLPFILSFPQPPCKRPHSAQWCLDHPFHHASAATAPRPPFVRLLVISRYFIGNLAPMLSWILHKAPWLAGVEKPIHLGRWWFCGTRLSFSFACISCKTTVACLAICKIFVRVLCWL